MLFSPKCMATCSIFIRRNKKKVKMFYFKFLVTREFFWYFFSLCFNSSEILSYLLLSCLRFSFFILYLSFCIYHFLPLLIFLYHFQNNLLLYLLSFPLFLVISFFNELIHFIYTHKQNMRQLFDEPN